MTVNLIRGDKLTVTLIRDNCGNHGIKLTVTMIPDIQITVLDDKHKQAKIGTDAPEDVEIGRDEIYEKFRVDKQSRNRDI